MADSLERLQFADAPIEIVDGDRGINYPKNTDFFPTGHCLFLNTGNVTATGFNFSQRNFITKEKDELLRKGKLRRHDVVLTTRGTVGNVAFFDESVPFEHVRINSGMVLLRADRSKLLPRFLYTVVRSPHFKEQVIRLSTGSAQPQLPIRDIRCITIPIPSLAEQDFIADLVGELDDKIDLNRRMNQTLEALARALFAHQFPHKPDDELPKGWRVGTLEDDFKLVMGQSPPGETYNGDGNGLSFYQGRTDFGFRFPTARIFCSAPTRLAEAGDTLVSVRAPVGDVNLALEKCAIGRGIAAVRHKSQSRSYTLYFLDAIKQEFDQFNGEGTVFGSINKSDFQNIPSVIPPIIKVSEFEELACPLDQQIENNERESRTLAALRDTLLPKLLSGELRVKPAEKILERHNAEPRHGIAV